MTLFFKVCGAEIRRSWWVVFFMLFCYMLYEHGMRVRATDYVKLETLLTELRMEQQSAKKLQENLLLQMNSQSDPAWVELTLIKGLGLVPEGQTKIYFTNQHK